MSKSLLEMAFEIVSGQSAQRILSGDEIKCLLRDAYSALKELERLESSGMPEGTSIGDQASISNATSGTSMAPSIDPSESIKETVIVCMECGKEFRQLTHTHLQREHGLTPDEYRRRYNIPARQPLAALAVSRKRKDAAQQRNLGEQLRQARAARRSDRSSVAADQAGTTERTD